jgi:DNA-binding MarR family transcriptional regulator
VVKRLIGDGLIVSRADPSDSRATFVALTEDGIRRSHDIFRIGGTSVRVRRHHRRPGRHQSREWQSVAEELRGVADHAPGSANHR